ncbi:MAG: hypothetical protein PWP23_1001 [Candidatus Sumerlaeota bacterium]|nr:hypothetical protein [Candidatus Sumerlaeota bacterium]
MMTVSLRTSLSAVAIGCSLLLAASGAWAQSLVESLPDDMLWCVSVRDASELRGKFSQSPLGAAWRSPEFDQARTALEEEWEKAAQSVEEDTGLVPGDVLKEIQGAAALFSTHLKYVKDGDRRGSEWDICLVAEVPKERQEKVQEMLRDLLDKVATEGERSAEEFRGIRIYRLDIEKITTEKDLPEEYADLDFEHELQIHVQYAFTDDHLVLCEGPNEPAKKVLNALLSAEAPRLGGVEGYRRLAAETQSTTADVATWVNIPLLLDSWTSADPAGEAGKMLDHSGVRSLGGAMLVYEMSTSEMRTRAALEKGREHSGIVEMLYSGGLLRTESVRRVPADVYNLTAWTLDLGPIWKTIREMMRTSGSGSDVFLEAWLTSTKQNFEVDLEADLIDHIAGEHVFYRRPPSEDAAATTTPMPGVPPEAMVPLSSNAALIGLTNGQQTVDALDKLLNKLTEPPFQFPIERQEQAGFGIWKVKEDAPYPNETRIAIGLTPTALVIGSSPLETREAMRRLAGGDEKALSGDPGFQAMMKLAPTEDLRILSYQSPDAYEMAAKQLRMQAALASYYDAESIFSADAVPPASWWKRYFGPSIAWGQVTPTMLKGESVFQMRTE